MCNHVYVWTNAQHFIAIRTICVSRVSNLCTTRCLGTSNQGMFMSTIIKFTIFLMTDWTSGAADACCLSTTVNMLRKISLYCKSKCIAINRRHHDTKIICNPLFLIYSNCRINHRRVLIAQHLIIPLRRWRVHIVRKFCPCINKVAYQTWFHRQTVNSFAICFIQLLVLGIILVSIWRKIPVFQIKRLSLLRNIKLISCNSMSCSSKCP